MRKQYIPPLPRQVQVNKDAVMVSLRAAQLDLELLAAWLEAEHEPVMAERSLEVLAWFQCELERYTPCTRRH